MSPADSLSKYASFGFDSSIGEIFPAFTAGTRLVIVPEHLRLSLDELDAYFAAHAVTVADLPTQFGEQFLQHATRHTLRAVRVGGEKLRTVPASACVLFNEYGPTEATVVSTSFRVDKTYDNMPIGRPIWNTQVLILDRLGRLARIGVPGELCIAGAGVARGYLNQPALTAEKFIQHPLARGQRLYRTGDLARLLDDGNLEFLGRIDTQVKVRGFRIELGEIEQALMALPGIRDATVIARENQLLRGDLLLVAFVTTTSADVADEAQLQAALARTLPPYMVPSRIVQLDAIPLTSNGKVDKRRLPQVELGTTAAIVEPRTPTERTLRPLYAEVLGLPEVAIGVETNFVALGGHSLKAALLLSAIFRLFGVQLRLAKFLVASSITEIAAEIDALKSSHGGDAGASESCQRCRPAADAVAEPHPRRAAARAVEHRVQHSLRMAAPRPSRSRSARGARSLRSSIATTRCAHRFRAWTAWFTSNSSRPRSSSSGASTSTTRTSA